jgi:hypothetical protein
MTERRYSDDEVRQIFEIATTSGGAPARAGHTAGLTLSEIQNIGAEVGLTGAELQRAAAALDAPAVAPVRRHLGMPIAVLRTVPLPRALTDTEWEQLVGELRATFSARGRLSASGGLREWSNGNLHACLEPLGTGYQLRIATRKGDAAAVTGLGIAGMAGGALLFAALIPGGFTGELLQGPFVIGGGGALALLANAIRLPRWAGERQRQMDHIAQYTAIMLEETDA